MPTFRPRKGSRGAFAGPAVASSTGQRVAAPRAAVVKAPAWRNRRRVKEELLFMGRVCLGRCDFPNSKRLLTINAFDAHPQSIEPFAGGDKQGMPIFSAKTNVGGP